MAHVVEDLEQVTTEEWVDSLQHERNIPSLATIGGFVI